MTDKYYIVSRRETYIQDWRVKAKSKKEAREKLLCRSRDVEPYEMSSTCQHGRIVDISKEPDND